MKHYIIYGLFDPRTGLLRYIGKSSTGLYRPKRHAQPYALKGNSHKENWIKLLLSLNLCYTIQILKESSKETLTQDEIDFIKQSKESGVSLVNSTNGGEGIPRHKHSESAKKKMSVAGKGKKKNPRHIERVANSLRGRHHSKSAIINISTGRRGKGLKQIQDQYGRKYNSIKEAAEALACFPSNISAVLNGTRKTIKGFSFTEL